MLQTKQEYDEMFPNNTLSLEDFNALAEIASTVIDELTMFRVSTSELFGIYPPSAQERVKKATGYQINFLDSQGGVTIAQGWGMDSSYESARVGNFQYALGDNSVIAKLQYIRGIPVSPLVNSILFPTGLLNRAVGVNGCGS